MRLFKLFLIGLFCYLQYQLWFGFNGLNDYFMHSEHAQRLEDTNNKLRKRNQVLAADVSDLNMGLEGVEERARNELGLIKQGETFFRIVPKS